MVSDPFFDFLIAFTMLALAFFHLNLQKSIGSREEAASDFDLTMIFKAGHKRNEYFPS